MGTSYAYAGPDDRLPGKGEDFLLDRVDEGFQRSTGQVRPACRPHEEGVARKEIALHQKTNGAGSVPWGMEDMDLEGSRVQRVAVLQGSIHTYGKGEALFLHIFFSS